MIQVQTKDWKNFGLNVTFTGNGSTYVSLVRLPAYLRNPAEDVGHNVWVLEVDSNDTGGSVNAAARIVAALISFIQDHSEADLEPSDPEEFLSNLRKTTSHTGVLAFTALASCERRTYSARGWLKGITE